MTRFVRHAPVLFCVASVLPLLIARFSHGAAPAADGLFPCGGKAGSEVEAELSGSIAPWPPQFWCSRPGIQFKPAEKAPRGTLVIPANCEPGPCLIRIWNADGASEPLLFHVAPPKETVVLEDEKKENSGISSAQEIAAPLPFTIYGRLNPAKDADCYRFSLKKGDRLHAMMDGYVFRTGLDAMLQLYDPSGKRIALAHDGPENLDPRLIHVAEKDGPHVLAVMAIATPPTASVSFHGAAKCSYRIEVARRGEDVAARFLPGSVAAAPAGPVSLPADLVGKIPGPGQALRYTFPAKAKEDWLIEAGAIRDRFATDPVFKLGYPDGRVIRETDDTDAKNRDAAFLWKVPADGDYHLEVRDRFGRGGDPYLFRLKIDHPQPKFSATVEKSQYLVEAGKETTVKLQLKRENGHEAPLLLEVKSLPTGVIAQWPEKLPEKSGEAVVTLKAAAGAAAHSGAITFEWREKEHATAAAQASTFSFQNDEARGSYLMNETSAIWLTVKAAAPPAPTNEGEKK